MTDLQAKYQKLAAEYAKLRAQLPVLKKAVLDEQANEEQLKNNIKEKDQAIRKYEQEIDSLTFRNNQLSTRVSVLQQELEDVLVQGKKHKQKNAVGSMLDSHMGGANASIFNEELRGKIEENARLHKQVYESEQEYRQELSRLTDELALLKSEAAQHEAVLTSMTSTYTEKIGRLQEDKALLEARVQLQEKETKFAVQQSMELEDQLRKVKDDLTTELTELSEIVQQKVLFNDTAIGSLNAWNIPRHDHRRHLQARELLAQTVVLLNDMVQAFDSFYTHLDDRVQAFVNAIGEPMSDVNKKFCQHLRGHSTVLNSVKQTYQLFHDSITDDSLILLVALPQLREFASSWKSFVNYVEKLLPYHLLSIEEECLLSSCPVTLSSKNMELHGALQRFVSTLSKVDTYVTLLAMQSDVNATCPATNHAAIFEHLSHTLINYNEAVKALSRCFNAKISLEHQLPTSTQKLKVADECIISAVVSLVTSTSKIAAFFSGNLAYFTAPPQNYGSKTVQSSAGGAVAMVSNPAVSVLRQRAVGYLTSINRSPPESVPYETALQNQKLVYSFTENKDSLTQQIITLQEKLSRLEHEREHWILETQLMQMKYEKSTQKLQSLSKSSADTSNPSVSGSTGMSAIHRLPPEGATTSILGQVEFADGGSHVDESDRDEGELREKLITKHYSSRITQLTSQLQQADSKALHFFAECRALQKRLGLAQRDRDKLQLELSSANQCITQLKDELQTTTRSYEGQLSMMSEHLAGMNERLTEQKDEIDVLRYQLQQQQSQQGAKLPGKKGRLGR